MALRRYEIRSEYGLADPEVYKSNGSEDDPDSVLEGVAMAGLVGLLRQLGDLAQFAAEIFHGLHEEAMATSARGHGLMVRVQQLEAEFPKIEKAFLTKTDHSSFFSNAGVEWHPNLRTEQNLVTHGDLPRFVMDSYEECRGPPRLFLLDKYDVAGAGACLKRYSDPSFFKLEAVSTGIANVDIQKEKKSRKVKKKGSRWRNGGTPDIRPSSHAKLHQLLLEERIQNNSSEPAHLVKLKRRQYNDLPFNPKTGKSFMEKFIQDSSPENGAYDASVYPLPLKFAFENSSDSGHDIVDIGTVSPPKRSSPRKANTYLSPAMHEESKSSVDIKKNNIVDGSPQSTSDPETFNRTSAVCDIIGEEELTVDGESKKTDSGYDYHSDDVPSDTEKYMDALATLESEIDADNEYRLSRGMSFPKAKTHQGESDANEEQSYVQAQYSDSQSLGNFSASDEGNGSVKIGGSSISYSDTPSTVAESMPPDTNGTVQCYPYSTHSIARSPETVSMPPDNSKSSVEVPGDQSHDISQKAVDDSEGDIHESDGLSMFSPDNNCVEKDGIADAGDSSHDTCIPGSNYTVDFELAPGTDDYAANLGTSTVASSSPTLSKDGDSSLESPEVCATDQLYNGHSKSCSGVLPWRSRSVDTYPEKESNDDAVVQRESESESSSGTLVCGKRGLLHSTIMGPEEQLASSSTLEGKENSGIPVSRDATLYVGSSTLIPETSLTDSLGRQKPSNDIDSAEEVIVGETCRLGDGEKTSGFLSNADAVQVDSSQNSSDNIDKSYNDIPEKAVVEDTDFSTPATSADITHSLDLDTRLEPSGFEDPHCIGSEADDIISVEHCKNSMQQMEGKLEISPLDVETDHYERPTTDPCVNTCSQSGAQENTGIFLLGHGTTVSSSTQASYMDPELKYDRHECIIQKCGDDGFYSRENHSNPAISSNQSQELAADEHKMKHFQAEESISGSANLQEKEMKSIDFANLEEQIDDSEKLCSDITKVQPLPSQFISESALDPINGNSPTSGLFVGTPTENYVPCSANFLNQPSACEIASQSVNQGLITKSMVTSLSVNLDPGFLHTGTEVSQATTQSSSDSFQLQLAQNELVLQSVGMDVEGNKKSRDQLDSIYLKRVAEDCHASSPPGIISHESSSELLLPISNLEGGGTHQAAQAVSFSVPCIVLPSIPPNFKDAPPLPPLPPMQWRMGKFLNPPQDSQKESFEESCVSLTSTMLQHSNAIESQPAAGGSGHPLSPSAEDVNWQCRSESFSNSMVQKHGISYQNSAVLGDVNHPTTEELHHPNPFLAEQPINEKAIDDLGPGSASLVQSGHGSTLPLENLAAPNLEAETVHPSMQILMVPQNLPETSVEGKQKNMHVLDGEMAQSIDSSSDIAESGVAKPKKIPRPRSPLIDAVAAHDRSTLRKVTERAQPQVAAKADERDSLLEQIRNKSFNLKPAVVNRPIIHGPRTNLKVTAILEKANQIRQALVGSDEDDDADSWSDS